MANGLAKLKIEDFIENVNQVRREYNQTGRYIPTRQLVQLALNKPAKRFYVSVDEAVRQINNIKNGRGLSFQSKDRHEMYTDIYKRYVDEVLNSDAIEFKYTLIERIINSEAPKFYINPDEAMRQIREYYHNMQQKNKKRNEATC